MFPIYRQDGHVKSAYGEHTLVQGIRTAKRLAKENKQPYTVCYPSAAPIVTVAPSGKIRWYRQEENTR